LRGITAGGSGGASRIINGSGVIGLGGSCLIICGGAGGKTGAYIEYISRHLMKASYNLFIGRSP